MVTAKGDRQGRGNPNLTPKWGASNLSHTPRAHGCSAAGKGRARATGTTSEGRSPLKPDGTNAVATQRRQWPVQERHCTELTPLGFRANTPLPGHDEHPSTRQGRTPDQHLQGSVFSGTDRSGESQHRESRGGGGRTGTEKGEA